MIPAQEAMNLKPGMRLEANFSGQKYKLEVERVTPWYVALLSDRRVRTRLIDAPDDLAPARDRARDGQQYHHAFADLSVARAN